MLKYEIILSKKIIMKVEYSICSIITNLSLIYLHVYKLIFKA